MFKTIIILTDIKKQDNIHINFANVVVKYKYQCNFGSYSFSNFAPYKTYNFNKTVYGYHYNNRHGYGVNFYCNVTNAFTTSFKFYSSFIQVLIKFKWCYKCIDNILPYK